MRKPREYKPPINSEKVWGVLWRRQVGNLVGCECGIAKVPYQGAATDTSSTLPVFISIHTCYSWLTAVFLNLFLFLFLSNHFPKEFCSQIFPNYTSPPLHETVTPQISCKPVYVLWSFGGPQTTTVFKIFSLSPRINPPALPWGWYQPYWGCMI